jgi:hypothetical protein
VKLSVPIAVCSMMAGSCLVEEGVWSAPLAAAEVEYQPGTPFVYLFDTGVRSGRALSARSLAAVSEWALVPEDTTEHRFRGDAVLLNDKLCVVLRAEGPGAEVYSKTARGLKPRAVVMPTPLGPTMVTGTSSIRILENSPAAVAVVATFQTRGDAGPCSATFRLTTGQSILETSAGPQAERLFVWCRTRHVVVPDFFGDDMVFSADDCDLARYGLPTENFLLNLVEGGDAMVMCVWRSGRQEAHAVLTGEGAERAIRGCEIQGVQDAPLWIAFLDAPGIWHERTVRASPEPAVRASPERAVRGSPEGAVRGAADPAPAAARPKDPRRAATDVVLDWKPPFPAQWRADFVRSGGFAESRPFRTAEEEGENRSELAGSPICRFDGDRAVVHIPESTADSPRAEGYRSRLVVYPIDRSRATPLTAFCPVDILRNTLSLGPCQYILDLEGLAAETNPTPASVTAWIESQFERNKQQQAAREIQQRLEQMIDHVGRAQARIDEYAMFAREVGALWTADLARIDQQTGARRRSPDLAAAGTGSGDSRTALEQALPEIAQAVARFADRVQEILSEGRGATEPVERARALADGILALIGKGDALAECRQLGAEVRRIGADQDAALSKCRMAVRWLKQQARMSAVKNPRSLELAGEIERRAGRLLNHR